MLSVSIQNGTTVADFRKITDILTKLIIFQEKQTKFFFKQIVDIIRPFAA